MDDAVAVLARRGVVVDAHWDMNQVGEQNPTPLTFVDIRRLRQAQAPDFMTRPCETAAANPPLLPGLLRR
jgi:hypothetical protein